MAARLNDQKVPSQLPVTISITLYDVGGLPLCCTGSFFLVVHLCGKINELEFGPTKHRKELQGTENSAKNYKILSNEVQSS